MSKHQIVVLANSLKHHQHCVAGKLTDSSKWVRPVSNVAGAELSHEQAKCQNPHGRFFVKPLQKVTIGLECHAPLINQPENYLIDDSIWQQNYKIDKSEVLRYLDSPDDLWGVGDRVDYKMVQYGEIKIDQSLYLIEVSDLNLYLNNYNKRRASFIYSGNQYDLAVTDPNFDALIQDSSALQNILCISLGEEYEGSCYKLVATVF
ncbi:MULTISPECIES: dual OB domain-containing protein [unclassified Pseudoalteromonas]|uniref:dual OB domain-containing protein n=1 Tax=unclassified Pseudoalteromonas TaxID=194690 RepID=UPI00048EBA46|nr:MULTISPECIES: hypothetical protein [unclassified Pseudoalteromonas]|tara:strand:- start:1383 stop:1997 length:615 start_codon:yes stop_codon:yes gene_type:complete